MKKIGDIGENIAKNYLIKSGYEIIIQNYKYSRIGEIDIIAKTPKGVFVFIEVKFRKNNNFGGGEGAITSSKKEKIYLSIMNYITENDIDEEDIRFDVIIINKTKKKLIHYKNQQLN
ncbi:MAG: YraN family protein [Candidatus Gracilibacteria bacterium]|nr:YraN family protein [Candidatus Gracilibacteria bacterium]